MAFIFHLPIGVFAALVMLLAGNKTAIGQDAAIFAEPAAQAKPLAIYRPRPRPENMSPRAAKRRAAEAKRQENIERMAEIRRLIRNRQLPAARARLTAFVADNPGLLSGRLMLARVMVQLNDAANARALLQNLAADNTQSRAGRDMANRLLQKLAAGQEAIKRRKKQRRGTTSINLRQRSGLDRNVRRAALDDQIIYYLGNVDALSELGVETVLAPTPGAVNRDIDEQADEIYFDTIVQIGHRWENLFADGDMWRLNGTYTGRRYASYDDNGDGIGDGNYNLGALGAGFIRPFGNVLLGSNVTFSQLNLGGEAANRSGELSGNLIMPFGSQPRPATLSLALAVQIIDALPLAMNADNRLRSGHTARLQASYQQRRGRTSLALYANTNRQRHDDILLDADALAFGVKAARDMGAWQINSDIRLMKKINKHAPTADDFEAIWGLQRRHDDTLSVNLRATYPVRSRFGEFLLSFDITERHTNSNLQRYNVRTGDIGVNLGVRW